MSNEGEKQPSDDSGIPSQKEEESNKQNQQAVLELNRRKRNCKRNTTKIRHQLEKLIISPPTSDNERKEIEHHVDQLWGSLEETQIILDDLTGLYLDRQDYENQKLVMKESEEFEIECQQVIERAQKSLLTVASAPTTPVVQISDGKNDKVHQPTGDDPVTSDASTKADGDQTTDGPVVIVPASPKESTGAASESSGISTSDKSAKSEKASPVKTIHRKLEALKVPTFDGNKTKFEEFWTLFLSLVDMSDEPINLKMARLRQSLTGSALESIRGLGISAPEYEEAKEILQTKFGGQRRQLRAYLDDLEKMPTLRSNVVKGFEKFADLVRITVVKLQAEGKEGELGDGTLHSLLVKKMTDQQLEKYTRWVNEHHCERSVIKLRDWLKEEVAIKVEAVEMAHGVGGKSMESSNISRAPRQQERVKTRSLFTTAKAAGSTYGEKEVKRKLPCALCEGSHGIWSCRAFQQKPVQERWNIAKEKQLCFRCLSGEHQGKDCRRSQSCNENGCQRNHHRLLHRSTMAAQSTAPEPSPAPQAGATTQATASGSSTGPPREGVTQSSKFSLTTQNADKRTELHSLRTIPVWLKANGRKTKVNAILDDASNETFLNEEVANLLGLKEPFQKVQVHVLNSSVETFQSMPVRVEIENVNGDFNKVIEVKTCPHQVTGTYTVEDWSKKKEQWQHLEHCDFPKPANNGLVDLLIGVDNADLHYSMADVSGKNGGPVARLGPLGWTCIGATGRQTTPEERSHLICSFFTSDPLHRNSIQEEYDVNNILRRFWEVESYGTEHPCAKVMTREEKEAFETVQSSLVHTGKRYQVSVPWKENGPQLTNNRGMALKRLESTEKNLASKVKFVKKEYQATLEAYVEKGYMRKVPPEEETPLATWYLPHFPIVRLDKTTTKVRIVFDCSAKHNDVSLNDAIHSGPKLQAELFDVLVRFRRNPVGIVCDIKEMYLQIEIEEKDRPFFRILWRDCESDRMPDEYEFTRVVFGKNSAPMEAQFVAQENARRNKDRYPLAAETVLKSTYMDDSIDSVEDEETGVELYHQLQELWQIAGMQARKWVSNSKQVIKEVPEDYRASEILINDEQPITKTLGVSWSSSEDTLTVSTPPVSTSLQITKRNVLRKIAAIFDPLGLISPVVISGKMLLQTLWARGYDWDDEIQDETAHRIQSWLESLAKISQVQIPRCIRNNLPTTSFKLITFVDASTNAYGAAVYARFEYEQSGSTTCRLIASKSRVAPLKPVTVPRLELMAAIIGLRLTQVLIRVLQVPKNIVTFYSDSLDVLWWIRGHGKDFRPFVSNRVGEIQMFSDPAQWQHVPTDQNPADLISRGFNAEELAENSLWWNGPEWLLQDEKQWPRADFQPPKEVKERRQTSTVLLARLTPVQPEVGNEKEKQEWRLDPKRFSSWSRLVRVHARVIRVICNMQSKHNRINGTELHPEEILDAEEDIIRQAQYEAFTQEYKALQKNKPLPTKSPLVKLSPRLDDNGIIRLEGRLMYAEYLPYDVKFPIILPRGHPVSKLIVKYYHEMANHAAGTNFILSQVSQRFWIIAAREEIRSWENECNECKRRKAKCASQVMAPLPQIRLRFTFRPFDQCAVDYAGPFITVQGRGKARQKRYLCLFTCLATRAIHLEMAWALDTDSFLNAFTRFTSRRGVPTEMISDNGTNFVGAVNELRELVSKLDKDQIQRKTSHLFRKVTWRFNPPAGPHFGGVHESMIKAAKTTIYAVLRNSDVKDEELITTFTGVESLLNSRPLTYQSSDYRDATPLTPNHFLHGQMGGEVAPESVDTTDFNLQKRWRKVQQLITQVWSRWLNEYLPTLNRRPKWTEIVKDMKEGDIVLALEQNLPRGRWPLGRIVETYPGKDGRTRVAKVQCGSKTVVRPIHKLVPLIAEK